MTNKTINKDQIKSFQPGFTYTEGNESATILHGVTVSSSLNAGVFSDFIGSSLINHGKIFALSDFPGVQMQAANSLVFNAFDGIIRGAFDGVRVDGSGADVVNAGVIRGLGDDGVEFSISSAATSLKNTGTIYGKEAGVLEVSNFAGGVIRNGGLITSDLDAIAINTQDTFRTVVANSALGSIRGGIGAGADAIEVIRGTLALTNLGTITGAIDVHSDVAARDSVINSGQIKGSISLNAGNDLYLGTGGSVGTVHGGGNADTLVGGKLIDSFFGDAGNDKLSGAAGNDRLHGGFGSDTLTGGDGKDLFFFDAGLNETFNVDRVTDFAVNVDKLMLDGDAFFGIGAAGVLSAAQFHIGAAAADANDHIIYNANTGFLFFDLDGNGGQAQTHFATIGKHLALDHADFVVTA